MFNKYLNNYNMYFIIYIQEQTAQKSAALRTKCFFLSTVAATKSKLLYSSNITSEPHDGDIASLFFPVVVPWLATLNWTELCSVVTNIWALVRHNVCRRRVGVWNYATNTQTEREHTYWNIIISHPHSGISRMNSAVIG